MGRGEELQRLTTPPFLGPPTIVGEPPAVPPNWFQNRDVEVEDVERHLGDARTGLVMVVGGMGFGKSAMIHRLWERIRAGSSDLRVHGLVYLSAHGFWPVTWERVINDLTEDGRGDQPRALGIGAMVNDRRDARPALCPGHALGFAGQVDLRVPAATHLTYLALSSSCGSPTMAVTNCPIGAASWTTPAMPGMRMPAMPRLSWTGPACASHSTPTSRCWTAVGGRRIAAASTECSSTTTWPCRGAGPSGWTTPDPDSTRPCGRACAPVRVFKHGPGVTRAGKGGPGGVS